MRILSLLTKFLSNPEFREQLVVFTSHFILNLSLFAITLLASAIFNDAEFARFTLANNYILVGAMLIDGGVNSAALKLSIEGKTEAFVVVNWLVKGFVFALACFALAGATLVGSAHLYVVILCCSSAVALWYSMRGMEQYERQFGRFALLNLVLAGSRIFFGGLALLSKSWLIVLLAVHLVALLPGCAALIPRAVRRRKELLATVRSDTIIRVMRIAPAFFVVSILFSAIPAIVQTGIFLTGDVVATGAFGIVLLFIGPITLATNTLRIYLQPEVLHKELNEVDGFGLGPGALHIIAGTYSVTLIVILLVLTFVVEGIYSSRFAGIGLMLLVYGGASCIVEVVGIYNMRVWRGDRIWLGLKVNSTRAVLAAIPLFVPQVGATAIVVWSSIVLIAGEIALYFLLSFRDRHSDRQERHT